MIATVADMSRQTPLLAVIAAVAAYGLVLVVAGLTLARTVFEILGFGLDDGRITADQEPYLRLVFAVLGAVIVGWMTALAAVVRRFGSEGLPVVIASIAVWFVVDTGISLVLGFLGHAAFNVGFVLVIAPAVALAQAAEEISISTPLGSRKNT